MESSGKRDADLTRTSRDLSTILSNQIYLLQFCLINFETVANKIFASEY